MTSERQVIKTIKKVMPAVVSIMVSKRLEDLEKEIPKDLYPFLPKGHDGKKLEIPEQLVDKDGMVNIGGGSGFIVGADGIVVTNKHVIADKDAQYTIVTSDDKKYPATILTRDPINDVAILKIEAKHLPVVTLCPDDHLELGTTVVAIGNALGLFKNTVSVGIVSGLSRAISAQAAPDAPPQEMRGLVQTDAAINPGNSGGPLVNLDGYAIGINAAIVFGAQNIGFAIPISAVRKDLADLKLYGRIRRPLLGVRYLIIDENLQAKMKLPVGYGALVTGETTQDHAVVPDGPAAKAGIVDGDIILECNTKKVDRDHPIQDTLQDCTPGDVMRLLVLRSGQQFEVSLTLTERK